MSELLLSKIFVFKNIDGRWAVTGPRVTITSFTQMVSTHCAFGSWEEAMQEASHRAFIVMGIRAANDARTAIEVRSSATDDFGDAA